MELLQTTRNGKGKSAHKHYVYYDPALGGTASVVNDHSHEILPEQRTTPPIVDPQSQIVLSEGTPPEPQVKPAGKDNHSHTLVPVEADDLEIKTEDDELVSNNKEMHRIGVSIEEKATRLAEGSEEFYMGKQWKDEDKKSLQDQDRAALTINEIESKIDLLSGYQRQNRTDFKFLPTEEGDAKVADILNVVVKNICDKNDWEFVETSIFEDGAITGRGNIHAYLDYSENPEGEIKLEHFPWRDVKYGPHNKKDGSDVEFVTKAKWYSKDKVMSMFPEKKDEIMIDWEGYAASVPVSTENGTDYPMVGEDPPVVAPMNEISPANDTTANVSITRKEYLLIESEFKEYTSVPVLFSQADNFFQSVAGLSKAAVKNVLTIPALDSTTQVVTKIRRVTTCGGVLLRDDYLEDNDFSLIPFYAKKRGNYYWGKIEGVKDLQLEINKRHSQSIDIVNKMAAYGWFYDSDTFENPVDEGKFTAGAAKPGFKIKVQDINKIPVQAQGTKFPVEIAQMMDKDSSKIKEIMNINLEMAGMARSSQSGVAIVEQKRQGLVGNEFIFDNLSFSKKRLGRKIIHMIKIAYTPQRLLRIVNSQLPAMPPPVQAPQPGGGPPPAQPETPVEKYTQEEMMALLQNDDLTAYDVVVAESKFNPTNRLANFMIWSDLASKGAPIPIMSLVDMSDAPDKDKMKEDIKAEMERTAATENNKNQTEIQKTKIAHGQSRGAPGETGTPGTP